MVPNGLAEFSVLLQVTASWSWVWIPCPPCLCIAPYVTPQVGNKKTLGKKGMRDRVCFLLLVVFVVVFVVVGCFCCCGCWWLLLVVVVVVGGGGEGFRCIVVLPLEFLR